MKGGRTKQTNVLGTANGRGRLDISWKILGGVGETKNLRGAMNENRQLEKGGKWGCAHFNFCRDGVYGCQLKKEREIRGQSGQ